MRPAIGKPILVPANPGGAVGAIPRGDGDAGGSCVNLRAAPARSTREWSGLDVDPDDLVIFKLGRKRGDPEGEYIPSREEHDRFLDDIARAQRAGRLETAMPFEIEVLKGFRRPITGDPDTDPEGIWVLALGEESWMPSREDVEQLTLMLNLIMGDPDAVLVYDHGITGRWIPMSHEHLMRIIARTDTSAQAVLVGSYDSVMGRLADAAATGNLDLLEEVLRDIERGDEVDEAPTEPVEAEPS